jgi:hypothetical protein
MKGLLAVKVLSRPMVVTDMNQRYAQPLRQCVVGMLAEKPRDRHGQGVGG